MEDNLAPVLLWPGSKRRVVSRLLPLMPDGGGIGWYAEPFLGSGSVLFALRPDSGAVGDADGELMTAYREIRDHPDGLMDRLRAMRADKDMYLSIRAWDREPGFHDRPPVDRAARTIYLSLTGYNGLHRLNSKGQNNVPFDRFRTWDPDSFEPRIRAQSKYLSGHDLSLHDGDFAEILDMAPSRKDVFAYIDPPYDSEDGHGFVQYTERPFTRDDQVRLKEACDRLDAAGARFMVSNADTPFIRDLWHGYDVTHMSVGRKIGAATGGASRADELVIRNYTCAAPRRYSTAGADAGKRT